MQRKQLVALLIIIIGFTGPTVAWAVYTGYFSDNLWTIGTMKADQYYVGTDTLATYINNIATAGLGTNVTESDHIIWKDGATYYSQNGATGTIISNANFYTLTTAVFAACTGGEVIYIKPGTYTLGTRWTITKTLNIIGSGKDTIIDFTGATGVIRYDATVGVGIRDGSLRNLRIDANNLIGIQIDADVDSVFSQCIIDNIWITDCSKGIYFSDSGSTVYKNTFSQIIITDPSTYGLHLLGGVYNNFYNIEVTLCGNGAYAIYNVCQLSVWDNISVDGVIHDDGPSNVWNSVSIETIYGTVPGGVVAAFRMAGESTIVNMMQIAEVANAKCNEGLAIFNVGQTVSGLKIIGADYPDYPLTLDASSSGVINSAETVGGFYLTDIYTPGDLAKWVINSGNILDGTEGSSYIPGLSGFLSPTVFTQASPYGYIISKSGGTYYANSTTGLTNYSGATASTVINNAIDTLNNGGIYFKAATYTITAEIDIAYDQNIMIRGDGQRAAILDSSGAGGVTNILDVGDGTDVMYGFSIADIGFKGVTGTTQCIRINNSRSATIERCYFTQYKYGVFFDGTLGAFHQNYAHAVRDCTMNGPNPATSTAGIYLSGFDNSWKCTTTEIRNCYILYNLAGIKASYTSQLSVIGGSLEWNGIGLDIYTYSNRGKFYSLNCESNSVWDIRIQGAGDDCDYNMFYACDLWTVGKYLSDGGWGNTFNDCANAP